MGKDFLYSVLAQNIASKIKNGVLRPNERLPSVRVLSKEHGVSMNTAKRVFLALEAQSLIYSIPQSGYFVNALNQHKLQLPETGQIKLMADSVEPNELISSVYANMGRKDLTLFSIGVPSGDLLLLAKLKKEIVLATRELDAGGAEYEPFAKKHRHDKALQLRIKKEHEYCTGENVHSAKSISKLYASLLRATLDG